MVSSATWVKICGITTAHDVEAIIEAGADAIGLNFVAWSKRRIDAKQGLALAQQARGRIELVGVVCDLSEPEIRELVRMVGLDRVQLHGEETGELVARLGGLAFKAMGVASEADVARAAAFPGDRLLVDTAVGAQSGGTGKTFDWSLVKALCRERPVIVAGGLHPGNVADAIATLSPFGVDVASGVEPKGQPGVKDPELVRGFMLAVRQGDARRASPLGTETGTRR